MRSSDVLRAQNIVVCGSHEHTYRGRTQNVRPLHFGRDTCVCRKDTDHEDMTHTRTHSEIPPAHPRCGGQPPTLPSDEAGCCHACRPRRARSGVYRPGVNTRPTLGSAQPRDIDIRRDRANAIRTLASSSEDMGISVKLLGVVG